VGGVLKMSTLRKAAFFCFRKSTDFRQLDQVGFWKTTISLSLIAQLFLTPASSASA
jgi:hypothetical protein